MLKNHHLSQNRTHPQTETPSMSSTHTYTLGEREGDCSQPASMSANEPEDDDDICPVCESECTCANRSRNVASPPASNCPTGYLAQDVSKESNANGSSARPPSLKIKLTLSTRSYSPATKASNSRSPFSKRKSKHTSQGTIAAGSAGEDFQGCSQTSIHGGALTTGGARDIRPKNDVSIPKKRGRPTKAVIAAREIEKNASGVKQAEEVTRQSIGNVTVARQSRSSIPRRAHQVNSTATKKGKKLHGAAAASRSRAQQRKAREKIEDRKGKRQATVDEEESSELSELDDDDDHPFGLPTFVPAVSSSSNSSSSESGEDTDSDCDKGIPPYPLAQHPAPLPLIDSDHFVQRRREYHNTWDIRVRKKSVGAEGSSDADMDSDSGDEEEQEGDDEAEGDENDEDEDEASVQPTVCYSEIATGWTDDEESSFDADIFFANLSDSSSESSDDEHAVNASVALNGNAQDSRTGTASTIGLDVMRLSEAAAAGFLAPFADLERATAESIPFGQGWDSLMDLDVDLSRRLPLGSLLEPPIPGYEEAEAMMATSEEEEAVAIFDNCSQALDEDEVLEIFEDSDGGETTEDEFIDVGGIATPRREVLLRFPASLGAIDPMSTLSSPVRERNHHEKASTSISARRKSTKPRLKPSDFLSGRASIQEGPERVESKPFGSPSRQPLSAPVMGSFIPESSKSTRHAVISHSDKNSSKTLPCPYPAVRRLRGRGTSVSMFSRSGSDRSHRSRTPSLLAATRSPPETRMSGDFDSPDDAQPALGEPIRLDDIIDAKLLGPERSDVTMPESTASDTGEALEMTETCESESERDRHLANLRRWDRIPIDAFRKTRTYVAESDLADNMSMVIGTPRAPRPSDGFSYGSASGGVIRGSPLSATLWGSHAQQPSSPTENKRGKLSSLLVSPLLLPIGDGDRTPTAQRQQQRQQHAAYTQQNIKSRKELRKEKKRSRKFFGSAPSHIRHNHFPNAKSRATSSMQRVPSLNL